MKFYFNFTIIMIILIHFNLQFIIIFNVLIKCLNFKNYLLLLMLDVFC